MPNSLDKYKMSEHRNNLFYGEVNEGKRMKKGHRARKKRQSPLSWMRRRLSVKKGRVCQGLIKIFIHILFI